MAKDRIGEASPAPPFRAAEAAGSEEGAASPLTVEIHDKLRRQVVALAIRLLGRRDEALIDDILGDAYVLYFEKVKVGDWRPNSVGNWLYGVCKILVTRARTARAKSRASDLVEPIVEIDPAADLIGAEMARALRACLSEQAPDRRRVLWRHHVEGEKTRAISRSEDLPHGTVVWHLAEGRARLRECVKRRMGLIENSA